MDLILKQGPLSRTLHLADGVHLIGRDPHAAIHLSDPRISVRHAQLRVAGNDLYVRELGSLNGTRLNGRKILPEHGEVDFPPGASLNLAAAILQREAGRDTRRDSLAIKESFPPMTGLNPPAGHRILEALSGLFELVVADDESIEDKACAFVADLVPDADRVVMLEDSGEGTPLEKVGSWSRSGEATEEVRLSSTIVAQVMNRRAGVLLHDTHDHDLSLSESMVALHLHSAMAVPLFDNRRVRGILYVDTFRTSTHYGEDELQVVTITANAVAVKLRNRSLEKELATASRIQQALLPQRLPEIPGYEIHARLDMCRSVGGDLYHLVERNRATLLLAVGDVAGKGTPAALAMSACMLLISTLAEISTRVDAMVNLIHRQLWENLAPEQFITLFLAELDPGAGLLTYINAGHEPPRIVRAGGRLERLGPTGPPVALLPDSRWIMEQATLEAGDLMAVCTDGIPEATLDGDVFLDAAPLEKMLASRRTDPLVEISGAIFGAVEGFLAGNPSSDDATLLLLRRDPA